MTVAPAPLPAVSPAQLFAGEWPLELDDAGSPIRPVLFVDLEVPNGSAAGSGPAEQIAAIGALTVGLAPGGVPPAVQPLAEALDLTLVESPAACAAEVAVPDAAGAAAAISG